MASRSPAEMLSRILVMFGADSIETIDVGEIRKTTDRAGPRRSQLILPFGSNRSRSRSASPEKKLKFRTFSGLPLLSHRDV